MRRQFFLSLMLRLLVLADIFYVFSYKFPILNSLDNILIIFFMIIVLMYILEYIVLGGNKVYFHYTPVISLFIVYSIFIVLNFSNDNIKQDTETYLTHRQAIPAIFLFIVFFIAMQRDKLNSKKLYSLLLFWWVVSYIAWFIFISVGDDETIQKFNVHIALSIPLFIYFEYNNKKVKFLLIILSCLSAYYYLENLNRGLLLIILFTMLTTLVSKIIKIKKLVIFGFLTLTILTLIYSDVISKTITNTSSNLDSELLVDSRSMVYLDFFADMEDDELIFGRGIMGYSFSKYFSKYDGDDPKRFSLEPGFLTMILKGGYIFVIFFVILSVISMKNGLYANNIYKNRSALILMLLLVIQIVSSIFYASTIYFIYLWFLGINFPLKIKQ